MAYRALIWGCIALGVAVSCAGDPAKKMVMDGDAGMGGEAGDAPFDSGGSGVTPQAGMPTVEAGSGGQAPLPAGGAGGEPAVVGGSEQGGSPNQSAAGEAGAGGAVSSEPGVSQCGEGNYLEYEVGCTQCPTPPEPNYPTMIDCNGYGYAEFSAQTNLLRLRFQLDIHEAFSGQVAVAWTDDDSGTGSGQYDWQFDPLAREILIEIPDAPANTQAFSITYLAFTDACGFPFAAQSINVFWNVETWSCGVPEQSACGTGQYESGGDGCLTCPALPEPNDPIQLGCGNFASANYNSYDNWFDVTFQTQIHEAFTGEASIGWQDAQQVSGQGDFSWSYDSVGKNFRFYVDTVPDDAQEFFLNDWAFTDACGYQFEIADLVRIAYDGDTWDIDCGG